MQATGVIAAESRSCRHPASLTPRFPARVLYPARGFRFFVDQRTAHSSEQRCTQRTNARRPRKDVWVEVQETVKETPQDRLLLYGGLAFVALLVVGPTLIAG